MTLRRTVLTRDKDGCASWARQLDALGVPHRSLPLLRHTPLPLPTRPPAADWVLFTSHRSIAAWAEAGWEWAAFQLGVVGPRTASALAQHTPLPVLQSLDGTGHGLAVALLQRLSAPGRILLPGAKQRLSEPGSSLRASGHRVIDLPMYRTDPIPLSELVGPAPSPHEIVWFASPSAVRAFHTAWPEARPSCVTLGPTTAKEAQNLGLKPAVSKQRTVKGMLRAADLLV